MECCARKKFTYAYSETRWGRAAARMASRMLRAIPAASNPTSASCSLRVAWAIRRSGMPRRVRSSVGKRCWIANSSDGAAEAVLQGVVFDRQHRMAGGKDAGEHVGIERLAEAGVDDADGQAVGGKFLGGQQGVLDQGAVGDDCRVRALAERAALPTCHSLGGGFAQRLFDGFFEVGCRDVVARIAQGAGRFRGKARGGASGSVPLRRWGPSGPCPAADEGRPDP